MTPDITRLQREIAQGIFDSLPETGWTTATYTMTAIIRVAEAAGVYHTEAGEELEFAPPVEVALGVLELREEMSALHPSNHAWYTARLRIGVQGDYKFDYSYDALPVFNTAPSKDKWEEEFRKHPRPELESQIPDVP